MRRTKSPAPAWATKLLRRAWKDRTTPDRCEPALEWFPTRNSHSSGRANRFRITVHAGTDEQDARLTLLHEIAHALTSGERGHPKAFWIRAFFLYRTYGNFDAGYAETRERGYAGAAEAVLGPQDRLVVLEARAGRALAQAESEWAWVRQNIANYLKGADGWTDQARDWYLKNIRARGRHAYHVQRALAAQLRKIAALKKQVPS